MQKKVLYINCTLKKERLYAASRLNESQAWLFIQLMTQWEVDFTLLVV